MFPIMLQTLKGGPKGNEANTCTHYQKQNKPQGSWLQFKSSTWLPELHIAKCLLARH